MSQPSRVYINGYYRRATDTANNFNVQLPTQILNPVTMSVNSCVLNLLAYNIPRTECNVWFQVNVGAIAVFKATLNTGKVYSTADTLCADLQTAMRASSGDNTITVTSNSTTDSRITIANTAGIFIIGIADREYNWNATYYDNASNRLGFYNASPTKSLTTPTTNTFTASAPLQLVRTINAYVCVDTVAGDAMTCNTPDQNISSVLFQMPITNPVYGGINTYQTQDGGLYTAKDLPYSINGFQVRVLDDNMDDLELLASSKVMIEVSFNYNDNINKQNK
jgi:hypothetical protein